MHSYRQQSRNVLPICIWEEKSQYAKFLSAPLDAPPLAYPQPPLLVFLANFRDRSTPDTEFLPLKALTYLISPDPSHHKLFWAKIRISKSDEENEVPQFSRRLILLLRCVLCRAKILRLQQNHSNRVPRAARVEAGLDKPRPSKTSSAFPQSVSNFSVQVWAREIIGNLKLPQN